MNPATDAIERRLRTFRNQRQATADNYQAEAIPSSPTDVL